MHTLGHHQQLLPTIQQYIDLRQSLVHKDEARQDDDFAAETSSRHDDMQASNSEDIVDSVLQGGSGEAVTRVEQTNQRTSAVRPESGEGVSSSRQLLARIAHLSEESVRASNEKVSVAQHVYDLVSIAVITVFALPDCHRCPDRSIHQRS